MSQTRAQRFDLHEAFNDASYDHALICTFAFDSKFFEDYCLEKLRSINTNGNITIIVDRGIYEKSILGPESERPTKANLRYLLHPVSIPGRFHSKLFLLARRNRGKLILGSANLTEPGITSNAEMMASFNFEEGKDEAFKPLFQAAFRYLLEIDKRFGTRTLDSNFSAVMREVPWLVPEQDLGQPYPAFLHNLDTPLWEQIVASVSGPVETIYVLSRYFDAKTTIIDTVNNALSPRRIRIFTQNGITTLTPQWLRHPLSKEGKLEINLCRFFDGDHAQPLHAKAIVIEKDGKCDVFFGSANFTSAALLRTIRNGNAEILLGVRDVPSSVLRPIKLLDPEGTAIVLKDASLLKTSEQDDQDFGPAHDIRLHEASVEGEHVSITAEVPTDLKYDTLLATLTFQRQARKSLPIHRSDNDAYFVRIAESERRRVDEESTLIKLEALSSGKKVADSNSLLLTNLKDFKTDNPLRRERYIREAEQSAAQFFTVLRDLILAGDDEALLTFLQFCNIPLLEVARPHLFRGSRPLWDGGEGMRKLGEKNLKIYRDLHEAALYFFDRHFRKLQRHVERRSVAGIANFLHIFLAMGDILRAQMERSVIGLESKTARVTTEEWADCRKHWDIYFDRFKQLMDCLWGEYVSPMIREYSLNEIKEEFGPDLEPIHQISTDMLRYRDRIEAFRTSKLKQVISPQREMTPGYFHCVLAPDQWPSYSQKMRRVLEELESTLDYAA